MILKSTNGKYNACAFISITYNLHILGFTEGPYFVTEAFVILALSYSALISMRLLALTFHFFS